MKIEIKMSGTQKEIEKYFKAKIYSKDMSEKITLVMSKKLKTDVSLLNITLEVGFIRNENQNVNLEFDARFPVL